MKLDKKITESSNIKSKDIDKKSILEILNIFNSEDEIVVKAVKNSLNEIHNIIDLTINSLSNDGRLFYIGAGTSEKSICLISHGRMSHLCKDLVEENPNKYFMVDLKIMNKKLLDRGIYIIQSLTQLDRKEAQSLLNQSNRKVKNAIIMHELDVTYLESEKLLESSNGSLRDLIEK